MIRSVEIKALRGICEGKLEDLPPLAILVGPNGCGKSSVLDALLIGSSCDLGRAISQSISRRAGVKRGARWLFWRAGESGPSTVNVEDDDSHSWARTFTLTSRCDSDDVSCRISKGAVYELQVKVTFNRSNSVEKVEEALVADDVRPIPSDEAGRRIVSTFIGGAPVVRLVDSNLFVEQVPLHTLYTQGVEQGRRDEVNAMVAPLVPGVSHSEILTDGDTPVLHFVYGTHSVPAALAGDGVHLALRLGLELVSRPAGLVLLEEPEVHQHPGAIRQSAKAILAAVRRDIQVILSTHSLELIDALLAEAYEKDLDKLAVYRLQLKEGLLKSHRIAGPDVHVARTQIEDDLR